MKNELSKNTQKTEKQIHHISLKQGDKEIKIKATTTQPYFLNNGEFATVWAKELKNITTNINLKPQDTHILTFYIGKMALKTYGFNRASYKPLDDIKDLRISRRNFFPAINRLEKEGYIKRDKKQIEILFIHTEITYNGKLSEYDNNNLLCQEYFSGNIDLKKLNESFIDIKTNRKIIKNKEREFFNNFTNEIQDFDSDLLEKLEEKIANTKQKKQIEQLPIEKGLFD